MNRLIFTIGMLFFFSCCKQDDENLAPPCWDITNPRCENYDPCFMQNEVTADFLIGYSASDTFVPYENYATNGLISFKALEEDANYTWVLGAETLYVREFARDFRDINPGAEINVQLNVEKEPLTQCFPNDDGIDFKERSFTLVGMECDYPIYGYYRVFFTEKGEHEVTGDSVDIYMGPFVREPVTDWDCFFKYLVDESNGVEIIDKNTFYFNSTDYTLYSASFNENSEKMNAFLDSETLEISFNYENNNGVKISFTGRKLNP